MVVNIGVSGPGVIKRALERLLERTASTWARSPRDQADEFPGHPVGELMGREVARNSASEFGVVDLSLAPTPASATASAKSFRPWAL